jgi:hypothetical protein
VFFLLGWFLAIGTAATAYEKVYVRMVAAAAEKLFRSLSLFLLPLSFLFPPSFVVVVVLSQVEPPLQFAVFRWGSSAR